MGDDKNQEKRSQQPLDKGHIYEYMVSGMFQSQGYLTRRGLPLPYGNNQEATDIDLLGITFTVPFKKRTIICDCKNKARSKPHERVFWAKGLGQFVGASEIYVSLPKSSWELTKFASKGGVKILTSDLVEHYSSSYKPFGLADHFFYSLFLNQIEQVCKKDKNANEILVLTRKLFLIEDPYVALNLALDTLKNVVCKNIRFTEITASELNFWKYICCEMTILISLQILSISSDVLGFPKAVRDIYIREKLTYGDLDPAKARVILKAAENLANEVIKSSIPANMLPKLKMIDFSQIPPPSYAEDVVGLVERAYNNPEWYINLPQLLDYLLFEIGIKGNEFSDQAYRNIFKNDFAEEKLKVARNILAFIRDKTGFNWGLIWPKGEKSLSKNTEQLVQEKLL